MRRTLCLFLALLMAALTFSAAAGEAPGEEYALPREEGMKQVTFYWTRESANYAVSDMWIWLPGGDGHGYVFHECAYGGKVVLNVPENTQQVGFIVRTNCSDPGGSSWGSATKVYDGDRFATLTGDETVIYLKGGEADQYTSQDGGKTLDPIREFSLAAIISAREIRYFISPAARLTSADQVKVWCGGESAAIEKLSSLNNEVVTGVATLAEPIDLTVPCEMEIEGFGRVTAVPTGVFDTEEFRAANTYEGDDLGAVPAGDSTVFKVWAPTASRVVLNLFDAGDGGEARERLDMEKAEQGVWALTVPCGSGTYYTYSVTTSLGTQEAVDPYARAVGVNGDRGMVIDLAATDPAGFRDQAFEAPIRTYQDAVVWEVHVRDFSNALAQSKYPGKYLAFTETGLTNAAGEKAGLDYLTDLGVTHVHLQPIYDYATVDEANLDTPQFNWGYDPKNYNAPEGSYATDPYHGEVRVNELKQMVQALHAAGIGVVMDVVYNHTYAVDSCLNRIVPYYYYRWQPNRDPANGSGCGNETASERPMFRKYMVDSVTYWLEEYRLDGFRFDLMALHDLTTMQEIEQAVHTRNPKALIYGEGWTGGTSPLNSNLQATQANIRRITASEGAAGGIAVFNDAIRDGLKGSVFNREEKGYISGQANKTTSARVAFGLSGGATNGAAWRVNDAMVVNYMTSHDNHTLWDKLQLSNPNDSDALRQQMVKLGASVVLLSKGMPFFLAGEEMLRTKQGDENSYRSSDAVNNIDWDALTPGSMQLETAQFYRGLIRLRRENAFLTDPAVTVSCEILPQQAIIVSWLDGETLLARAWINPNRAPLEAVPETAGRVLLAKGAFPEDEHLAAGETVTVPARTVLFMAAE